MHSWKLKPDELNVESFAVADRQEALGRPAVDPGDGGFAADPEPAPTEGSSCITACTRYLLPCC